MSNSYIPAGFDAVDETKLKATATKLDGYQNSIQSQESEIIDTLSSLSKAIVLNGKSIDSKTSNIKKNFSSFKENNENIKKVFEFKILQYQTSKVNAVKYIKSQEEKSL